MTPDEAADLAARTLAVLADHVDADGHYAADRERVAADLAGLLACRIKVGDNLLPPHPHTDLGKHARRYADGLRRTAELYGVTL